MRVSMTSASPGRPLSDCARASSSINSGSFRLPFCTARQARSWKVSASPRDAASAASRRHSATSPHGGADDCSSRRTRRSNAYAWATERWICAR
jgi:hypothetical protein